LNNGGTKEGSRERKGSSRGTHLEQGKTDQTSLLGTSSYVMLVGAEKVKGHRFIRDMTMGK
jgi:hypothetical protein